MVSTILFLRFFSWGLCTSGPPAWHTPSRIGRLAFKSSRLVPFPVWFLLTTTHKTNLTLPSDASPFPTVCSICTQACVRTRRRPAATLRHLPQLLCTTFLRRGLSLKLGLTGLARLASQRAPGVPPVSTFPAVGLQVHAAVPGFSCAGDLSLGP